ncbi:MAG TPA: hypothetical protein VD766_07245 [Solirubrobacterales bacterium]|nr:hypothetical protein [Solirubrobacterales bacterium]
MRNGRTTRIGTAALAGIASISVATALGATTEKTLSSGLISKGVPHESVLVETLKMKKKGKVKDVNVGIAFDTASNEDYTFLLRHPSGKTIHISSGNGGSGNGYGSSTCASAVRFDDEAGTPVEDLEGVDTLLFGQYQPEELNEVSGTDGLSELDGLKTNGKWQLQVIDTEPVGLGSLRCFELDFTYKKK